jgi:hypothetical protein
MKKIILAIIAITFIAVSCDNTTTKKVESAKSEQVVPEQITTVTLAEFDNKVSDLVGQKIAISGTVDHICEHGGQKLFIVDTEAEGRVKVTPDENIAAFNSELEGENIEIVGIVEEQRIDENYLKEWEEEIKEGIAKDQGEGIHVEGEGKMKHEEDGKTDAFEKINRLREMLTESGEDHLSFYSVLCVEYKIIEITETED